MNRIKKWLQNQAVGLIAATSSVEKSILYRKEDNLELVTNQEVKHKQGTLADSLMQGIVTQEVISLRWRMYKVLQASAKLSAKITGYDEHGNPIIETSTNNTSKKSLNKVKLDDYDNFPLELVVDNSPIVLSALEGVKDVNANDESIDSEITHITSDENNDNVEEIIKESESLSVRTVGEITSEELNSSIKQENPIKVIRKAISKFNIEQYTTKLNIRTINDEEKLLEFYISKYPDGRKSIGLIREIKKAMLNPRTSDLLEIDQIGFISDKTLGVNDFHEFQYKITSFDKIVEYDGFYIIKFKANVLVDGVNVLEIYRDDELDEKYRLKQQKKKL